TPDLYTFCRPVHAWFRHGRLAELPMGLIVRAGGLPLLVALFAGLVTITAACLYWLLRRGGLHPTLAAILTMAGALAGSTAWGARPQVLNVTCFAVLACGLWLHREGKVPAWWVAPYLWVWANLHSGFLSGVILVGLFLAGEGVEAWRNHDARALRRLRGLALYGLGGLALAFVNPYGWDTVLFPLGTLFSPLIQNNIQEWASPDFHSLAGHLLEGILFVVVAAGMLGYRALPNLRPSQEAASIAAAYPVVGADALLREGRALRVLNYYDYGGYLIYRLWPSGSHVFIDGRVEVYGPGVFSDYLAVSYASPGWHDVVQ